MVMTKYVVLKYYKDVKNGSVDFVTTSQEDANLYAGLMERSVHDADYHYSVAVCVN